MHTIIYDVSPPIPYKKREARKLWDDKALKSVNFIHEKETTTNKYRFDIILYTKRLHTVF